MWFGKKSLGMFGAVSLALALAASACGGSSSGGTTKFTVALDWFPNADHAGIYAAQAQGFFAQEGLDVDLQVPSNPEDPPKFVATGRADIAISYEPDVIQAKAQDLPIKAVAAIVPVPLNSIQTLKTSGITSPAQLAGKKVGFPGIPSDEAYLQTILKKANVDPQSVSTVDVGFDLTQALRAKQVDAIIGGYWNVEAQQADLEGFPVNVMKLEDYGVPTYNELVFIVKEGIKGQQADNVRKFLRAVAKGHDYATAHADAAVDAVAKATSDTPRELINRGVKLLVPVWQGHQPWGHMDAAQWQSFADFLYTNKLADKHLKAADLMTNDFLP